MQNTDQMTSLLLEEIRQNRKEIQELRKEVWSLKARFVAIAVAMGLAGGKLSQFLPFLN
jgi:hypothetical protein